jgi:hypothetical protein
MNIKAKINARKVALSYFFEIYFIEELSKKDYVFEDVLKTDKLVNRSAEKDDLNEIKIKTKDYY